MNWNTYTILLLLFSFQNSFAQGVPSCNNSGVNSYPFDENDIIFPFDLTTSDCNPSGLSPKDLSYPYAKPTLNQDACDQVVYNYQDIHLPISGPACFKILRNWTVIDWCQYNLNAAPNSNGEVPGKWEHTQVIKVIDYSPPVFTTCPNDLVFENFESSCKNTFVELISFAEDCSPDLTYSYKLDLNNDGRIDQTGNSNNASGSYPSGNHKIYFTVSDGCGNLGNCSFSFLIKDGKKPTPVCTTRLDRNLDTNGALTIWASDFKNRSSFDNCTDYQNLKFSFSSDYNQTSLTFDCNHLGNQEIELWVTDEAGNQDFCTTSIDIQDNTGVCPLVQRATIFGNIQTENGIKLENLTIKIQDDLSNPTTSNSYGEFIFEGLPQSYDYTIIPEKINTPLNGVTTFDLVLIHKHILGLDPFDSPYQLIAADVNNSKTITTMDVVQIRRLILGMDSEFQNNNSWKFIDANYVFSNIANTLNESYPETITINNLTKNTKANFIAIKVGDVNESASPNSFTSGDKRNKTGIIYFQIKNKLFKKGDQIEVPIITNEFKDIIGYQFTIEFDANVLKLEKVNPLLENSTHENFNISHSDYGIITTSWHQHQGSKNTKIRAFSLIFRALEDGELVNNISINSTKTTAEAYYESGESTNVNLLFENTTSQIRENTIKLYQNKPNPVDNHTKIGFNIPNNENVNFEFTNIEGRIIKKINRNFPKGYNEIVFNKSDLETSGILFYSMEINGKTLTKTMIIND